MKSTKHIHYFHRLLNVIFSLSSFLTNAYGEHFDVIAHNSFIFKLFFELV